MNLFALLLDQLLLHAKRQAVQQGCKIKKSWKMPYVIFFASNTSQ